MRIEPVEIYSDRTNTAIMRHPGRKFPGVLVQGDSLWALCYEADLVCRTARPALDGETFEKLNKLRNALWQYLAHYKDVLVAHDLPLPFAEIPPPA